MVGAGFHLHTPPGPGLANSSAMESVKAYCGIELASHLSPAGMQPGGSRGIVGIQMPSPYQKELADRSVSSRSGIRNDMYR